MTNARVAVVTGASAGIGAATAKLLSSQGHPVALGARRGDRCEEVAAEIRATGGTAVGFPLDVTDTDSVKTFGDKVRAEYGAPGLVVSNAGSLVLADATTASVETIEQDLNLNVLGAHRVVLEFLPAMLERQTGDLVFVSSDVVNQIRPGTAGYASSKAGLEGLIATLQAELEGTGVRASVVRPGGTMSEIASTWDLSELGPRMELWKRWGVQRHRGILTPEQVALAITHVGNAPKGMHIPMLEVMPEAPVRARKA